MGTASVWALAFLASAGPIDIAKAEFSTANPDETARWIARHHSAYLKAASGNNRLATRNAKLAMLLELAKARGKRIDWVVRVEVVQPTTIRFQSAASFEGRDPVTRAAVEYDLTLEEVSITGLSVNEQRLAATLKRNDQIRVQGSVVDLAPDDASLSTCRVTIKGARISTPLKGVK